MIGQLSFSNAWVVWLIPLLLLLMGLTLVEARRRQTLLKAFGELLLMSRFSRLGPDRLRWLRPLLLSLALAGVTVALARPVLATRSAEDGGRPLDLVVLLDVSRSMAAEDYAPKISRLGKAKAMILEALSDLVGRRVGIVTFAGASFRQAPLTDDHAALKYILTNWVFIESAPPGGSGIAEGIRSATRLFEGEQGERIVLLFSDGGQDQSQDLRAALAEARSHGVRIFAFGLGGSIASKLPQYDGDGRFSGWLTVNGEIATTRLDEGVLEDIAAGSGGAYSRVVIGQELKQTLHRLKIPRERSPAEPRELFQWSLAAALVLLFLERVGATLPGKERATHATPAHAAKAIVGGFVGTVAITLMMYFVAPMMLGRPMDMAAMLGGMLGGSWMMGMLMHFAAGTAIFPLVYVYFLYRVLPGDPWLKGAIWGLILWFLSQALVTPMMGGGVFSAKAGGLMAVMASLIGHAIYGTVLGGIAAHAEPSPRQ